MADGVVDEDRDELAEPRRDRRSTSAGAGSTSSLHASFRGRPRQRRRGRRRDVAEIDRHALQRDRARIRAGEQQQVLDHRGHVIDLVADVGQRACRRWRRGSVGVAVQVVDAGADDGQRRAQLVRRVGGELALPAQRLALLDERAAGSGRVRGSRRPRRRLTRRASATSATDDQDEDQDVAASAPRSCGRRRSAGRAGWPRKRTGSVRTRTRRQSSLLDVTGVVPGSDRHRRPSRIVAFGRVAALPRRSRPPRQARRDAPAAGRPVAVWSHDHRERARSGPPKLKPPCGRSSGPGRAARDAGSPGRRAARSRTSTASARPRCTGPRRAGAAGRG